MKSNSISKVKWELLFNLNSGGINIVGPYRNTGDDWDKTVVLGAGRVLARHTNEAACV
jgi:hypothetical protein